VQTNFIDVSGFEEISLLGEVEPCVPKDSVVKRKFHQGCGFDQIGTPSYHPCRKGSIGSNRQIYGSFSLSLRNLIKKIKKKAVVVGHVETVEKIRGSLRFNLSTAF
jgi:hypothetical protein